MSTPPALLADNKDVRNARLLFAVLTIGFGVASVVYAAFPHMTTESFANWDRTLGGDVHYPDAWPNVQNRTWISLAAANVATLSLMSWLLWKDLAKNRGLHLPLLFMKSVSATLFVLWFFATPGAYSLLVAAVSDFATAAAVWYFPMKAFRAIDAAKAG